MLLNYTYICRGNRDLSETGLMVIIASCDIEIRSLAIYLMRSYANFVSRFKSLHCSTFLFTLAAAVFVLYLGCQMTDNRASICLLSVSCGSTADTRVL